jgi:hypothetical protein
MPPWMPFRVHPVVRDQESRRTCVGVNLDGESQPLSGGVCIALWAALTLSHQPSATEPDCERPERSALAPSAAASMSLETARRTPWTQLLFDALQPSSVEQAAGRLDTPAESLVRADARVRLGAKRHLEPDNDMTRECRQDLDQGQLAGPGNHTLEARLLHVVRKGGNHWRVGELHVPDEVGIEFGNVLGAGAGADKVHGVDEEAEVRAPDSPDHLQRGIVSERERRIAVRIRHRRQHDGDIAEPRSAAKLTKATGGSPNTLRGSIPSRSILFPFRHASRRPTNHSIVL